MELKGYYISTGYMGYVDGRYQLFATEMEYISYVTELLLNEKRN